MIDRFYPTTGGFSPQGTDFIKGILEFSYDQQKVQVDVRWLGRQIADLYDINAISFIERDRWVTDRNELWLSIADDPISNLSEWSNADKPFQALAKIFEYADYLKDPENFVSRQPITNDGKCNGIQHWSALLRDKVGGLGVNLVPTEKPNDIYINVSKVCERKILCSSNTHRDIMMTIGVPRKMAKKPVMTIVYGSTQRNCLRNINKICSQIIPKSS